MNERRVTKKLVRYQTIDVAGQRIRVAGCRLDEEGKLVPLLVINGIGASAELLEPFLLALDRPVISFDIPGIGGSEPAVMPKRMNKLAALAADVLDAMNVGNVHVFGVSWGGALAQQFARQFPDRCIGLILAATSSGHLMVPPGPKVLLNMATPMRYYSSDYFKSIAGEIYGGDFRGDKELATRHAKAMAPPSMTGYLHQLYAAFGWTSLFWLHKLRQDTLVLAGRDDPIVRLINGRILASRIPRARLKVFDCGHLFMLTRLEETVKEIGAFLSAIEKSATRGAALSEV